MRQAWKRWTEWSLILRILCGMAVGIALALAIPGLAGIELLGDLFVSALKAIAPILVFFLVMSSLARAKTGGAMKTIVVLYIIATFSAGIVAVAVSFAFPVTVTLTTAAEQSAPEGVAEVLSNLLVNMVENPIAAIGEANFLGVLFWSILLGLALRLAEDKTKNVLDDIADAVQWVVRLIINLAPFGILGLVYSAVSESGMAIFTEYGRLVLLLVASMGIVAFVTNPAISALMTHTNPYPLVFRCVKDSAITAFFTRSSAANIPVNMELCRKLGLNEDNYSVSIPLGATVNMGGATVTISVMSLAAANTLGIPVDFPTAVILCVLAAVSAAGASGVAGGSLLLIPVACGLLGISGDVAMQMVGIGFIIGVVQDSCETALNSGSDVLFTATAEFYERRKQGIPIVIPKDDEGVTLEDVVIEEAKKA